MTTLILPYPLSANKYWRPVNVKGHSTMVPTTEAKAWKAMIATMAIDQGMLQPFRIPVNFHVKLYPERPQDWVKRKKEGPIIWDHDVRCIDTTNVFKILCDALEGVAYIDDKQVFDCRCTRMEPIGHARMVVVIEPHVRDTKAPLHELPQELSLDFGKPPQPAPKKISEKSRREALPDPLAPQESTFL